MQSDGEIELAVIQRFNLQKSRKWSSFRNQLQLNTEDNKDVILPFDGRTQEPPPPWEVRKRSVNHLLHKRQTNVLHWKHSANTASTSFVAKYRILKAAFWSCNNK